MLVYIRERDLERVLTPPRDSDIPQRLVDRFENENKLIRELNKDLKVYQECGDVYLISPEIVHSVWPTEEGIPVMPGNFSKLPDAEYLIDRTQHVLVKMRINAKV